MFIYKITNLINGKIYIGQTTRSVEVRFRYHCYNSKSRSLIRNAINKYGKENFKIELIKECNSIIELNEQEIYYIKTHNSLTPNGYNIQKGGYIRDSMRGKKHSIKTRRLMSKKSTGVKNSQYGKIGELSPNYNVKKSADHIEKIAMQKRKKVLCVELNKTYNSLKDAAIDFNTSPSCISNAIYNKNRVKRYKGFTFKFVEETNG